MYARTARLFITIACLCAAAALPAAAHPGGHPTMNDVQAEKTTVKAPVTAPLDLAQGHPTIDVTIGGKGPYRFIVDTGAGSTVIDQALAKELGLPVVDTTSIGDPSNPGGIKADLVRIPSLEIGTAKFEGIRAASFDHSGMFRSKNPPRGVIGFAVFSEVLLTFDYVAKELRIAPGSLPKADGKNVVEYATTHGIPVLPISVGGVKMDADLDTGSSGYLSVPARYKDQIGLDGPLVEVGRARTVNSEFVVRGAPIRGAFEFGPARVEKPFVEVNEILPNPNVGSRALASFALTFDQKAKRVRFEQKAPLAVPAPPSSATNAAAGPPPSGIRFAADETGALSVYSVEPDSPGAKAGITAGEQVVRINGKPVAEYDDTTRRSVTRTSPLALTLKKGDATREVIISFP